MNRKERKKQRKEVTSGRLASLRFRGRFQEAETGNSEGDDTYNIAAQSRKPAGRDTRASTKHHRAGARGGSRL